MTTFTREEILACIRDPGFVSGADPRKPICHPCVVGTREIDSVPAGNFGFVALKPAANAILEVRAMIFYNMVVQLWQMSADQYDTMVAGGVINGPTKHLFKVQSPTPFDKSRAEFIFGNVVPGNQKNAAWNS